MSLLNAAMNTSAAGGDVSAKAASAATAYSMIVQAINAASIEGGYKIAEQQGVFAELAPLLDPALSISSAKISEAFDNATDALALASSPTFRDLLNNSTYLDALGRASAELYGYYGGYLFENVTRITDHTYDPNDGTEPNSALAFSPDGMEMVWIDASDNILSGPLSRAYDPSSVTPRAGLISTSALGESVPNGLAIKPDGTKVYVVGNNLDDVMQWTLSTPFDLSSAVYDGSVSINNVPRSINFSEDGTTVVFTYNGGVAKYTLSIPWDYINSAKTFVGSSTANPLAGGEFTYIDNGWGILVANNVDKRVDLYRTNQAYKISSIGGIEGAYDYTDLSNITTVVCADRYAATSRHFYMLRSGVYHLEILPAEFQAPV